MPDHQPPAGPPPSDDEIRAQQDRVDEVNADFRRQLAVHRAASDRDRAAFDAEQDRSAAAVGPGDDVGVVDVRDLDVLRRKIASATGAARAGVDVAEHGSRHLARQIVYALADGAADDVDLRPLLRELAVQSERLSGEAVVLYSRFNRVERAAKDAITDGHEDDVAEVVVQLQAVHSDGVAVNDAANAVRRRLPARYSDPFGLES